MKDFPQAKTTHPGPAATSDAEGFLPSKKQEANASAKVWVRGDFEPPVIHIEGWVQLRPAALFWQNEPAPRRVGFGVKAPLPLSLIENQGKPRKA